MWDGQNDRKPVTKPERGVEFVLRNGLDSKCYTINLDGAAQPRSTRGYTTPIHGLPTEAEGLTTFSVGPFETEDEAQAFAAQFPKACAVKVARCSHFDSSKRYDDPGYGWSDWWVGAQASAVTKTTGAKNEAGTRRFRSILRVVSAMARK